MARPEKGYYTVDDIMELTGMSKSWAYRRLSELRKSLKEKREKDGLQTVIPPGHVPKKWAEDILFGGTL